MLWNPVVHRVQENRVLFNLPIGNIHYNDFIRMGLFVGFHYVTFLGQYVAQMVIRDEPEEVSIQRQRQRFIVDKLVRCKSDREDLDPQELL